MYERLLADKWKARAKRRKIARIGRSELRTVLGGGLDGDAVDSHGQGELAWHR